MTKIDQQLWCQAYLAAMTGLHAYSVMGECRSGLECKDVDALASESADLAVKRLSEVAPNDPPWTGHARVELLGHRSYLGRIREIDRYGSRLGEVAPLNADGSYGEPIPFGGRSIYTITPVTLDDALKVLRPDKSLSCHDCGHRLRTLQWGDAEYSDPPRVVCDECKTDCRKCANYSGAYYGPCKVGIHRARGKTCEKFEASAAQPEDDDLPFDGGSVQDCDTCKHAAKGDFDEPCCDCRWMTGIMTDPTQWESRDNAAAAVGADCKSAGEGST